MSGYAHPFVHRLLAFAAVFSFAGAGASAATVRPAPDLLSARLAQLLQHVPAEADVIRLQLDSHAWLLQGRTHDVAAVKRSVTAHALWSPPRESPNLSGAQEGVAGYFQLTAEWHTADSSAIPHADERMAGKDLQSALDLALATVPHGRCDPVSRDSVPATAQRVGTVQLRLRCAGSPAQVQSLFDAIEATDAMSLTEVVLQTDRARPQAAQVPAGSRTDVRFTVRWR